MALEGSQQRHIKKDIWVKRDVECPSIYNILRRFVKRDLMFNNYLYLQNSLKADFGRKTWLGRVH